MQPDELGAHQCQYGVFIGRFHSSRLFPALFYDHTPYLAFCRLFAIESVLPYGFIQSIEFFYVLYLYVSVWRDHQILDGKPFFDSLPLTAYPFDNVCIFSVYVLGFQAG
jgi:hypothetical protein